jgi:hypothetical protein
VALRLYLCAARHCWRHRIAGLSIRASLERAVFSLIRELGIARHGDDLILLIFTESWVLPQIACCVTLCRVENAGTKELEYSTAIHCAFQHLQPVDLALYGTGGPRQV